MFPIASIRLDVQQLARTKFSDPAALVGWFGAMQAQEYHSSRWAVGMRLPPTSDANIAAAVDAGTILRTHILRPTWHLVAAADIRWMLALSGPRVSAQIAGQHKRLGITPDTLLKSHSIVTQALAGGLSLTRAELVAALETNGIHPDSLQAVHLMMQAELDGLICSGPMRGKEITYALLDERVPPAPARPREEAVAMLVRRYFQSHGPATAQDFAWWSGLTLTDAKAGLGAIKSELTCEKVDGQEYWLSVGVNIAAHDGVDVHFLPAFDEFLVAYKDRSASLDVKNKDAAISNNGIFRPVVLVNGRVVGCWQRTLKKNTVSLDLSLFALVSPTEKVKLEEKAADFGRFLEKNAVVQFLPA